VDIGTGRGETILKFSRAGKLLKDFGHVLAAYSSGANPAASRREQPADRRVDQRRRGVRF
jgi:hypothetical protein